MALLAGIWPAAATGGSSSPKDARSNLIFPFAPTLVPGPEWKPASPSDMSLRSDVRNLTVSSPPSRKEVSGLMQRALAGDAASVATLIAYWKSSPRLGIWESVWLAALSRATCAPERGTVQTPHLSATPLLSAGRMTPPLPLPLRTMPAEESERLALLPHAAWSTEELLHAALRGDEHAVAELAYYWTTRRKLAEMGPHAPGAPWRSDAEHWSGHWMAVWKSGRSYGVLASRLEENATLADLLANPAWAELMQAAAREAEGDAVRDSLRTVAAVLPKAGRSQVSQVLKQARKEGLQSLRTAARKGRRGAAARYHALLADGGSERDKREAAELIERAARAGDVTALRALALAAPAAEASQWRARAVDLGDVQAMRTELATLPAESERAAWLRRQLVARGDLDELMRAAEEIVHMPDASARIARLPVAESYLTRAAAQGLGRASLLLCRLYEGDFGGEPSPEKACFTARGMVGAHYAPGYLKMAEYKERGYGNCSRDLAEAYVLIEAAARSRMPAAMVQWARVLLRGIGTEPDPASAARILDYVRSVAPETPSLNFYLGYMYETGVGKARDLGKALRYYTAGAGQGDSRAMNNLASMYEAGVGVAADRDKALELYGRAAELGNEDGKANYARLKAGK